MKVGHLELLMEAMRWAPSGGNMQPWFFYVVTNEKAKSGLAKAAYGQSFLANAPVVFVVCADPEETARRYGERGRRLYSLQDTAASVENLLLAAVALGYGSCWVGAFDEEEVRAVLEIPEHLSPVAIVPVGPGHLSHQKTDRKPTKSIFQFVK